MNTVYVLGAGASAAAAQENKRVLGGDFLKIAFQRRRTDQRIANVEEFVRDIFHYDGRPDSALPMLEEVLSTIDIALSRGESCARAHPTPNCGRR